MISAKMQEAMNAQVNAEMWSAYLYLAMSLDAADKGLKGVANWFHKQYEEEMEHAFKFVSYLQGQLARVDLGAIAEFNTSWDGNPKKMFEDALAHEKKVTAMINNLYALASEEKDYASIVFLQWFVSEQVEEEAQCQDAIDALVRIGNDSAAMFMFDKQLAKR